MENTSLVWKSDGRPGRSAREGKTMDFQLVLILDCLSHRLCAHAHGMVIWWYSCFEFLYSFFSFCLLKCTPVLYQLLFVSVLFKVRVWVEVENTKCVEFTWSVVFGANLANAKNKAKKKSLIQMGLRAFFTIVHEMASFLFWENQWVVAALKWPNCRAEHRGKITVFIT